MRYVADVYEVEELFSQRARQLPTTRDIKDILDLIGVDYV